MPSKVNHAECSIIWSEPYQGTVREPHEKGKQWSVIQAATYFNTPPVIERIGEWAICKDGLYCLFTSYEIPTARFDEGDWEDQLAEKTWLASKDDFRNALGRAKALRDVGYIG